jgi:sterol desaturase/sphingolipid hydroxylase (fatty acid hydroxylase superfamily)
MIVAVVFALLLIATLLRQTSRQALLQKGLADWLLDGLNLSVQGTLIPLLQLGALASLMALALPELKGSLKFGFWGALLLNLLLVDYFYYWNHRALHLPALWPVHRIHHSVTHMDVFATSRNTLWSSFLILYLYLNGALLYLLDSPEGLLLGAAITASLDLWKHSELELPEPIGRVLGVLLIRPRDHAWHHATQGPGVNYGANFNLWDRLHGTWQSRLEAPSSLGDPAPTSLLRRLLWPWEPER